MSARRPGLRTFSFSFCFGVRSPWRTTQITHRSSSVLTFASSSVVTGAEGVDVNSAMVLCFLASPSALALSTRSMKLGTGADPTLKSLPILESAELAWRRLFVSAMARTSAPAPCKDPATELPMANVVERWNFDGSAIGGVDVGLELRLGVLTSRLPTAEPSLLGARARSIMLLRIFAVSS